MPDSALLHPSSFCPGNRYLRLESKVLEASNVTMGNDAEG